MLGDVAFAVLMARNSHRWVMYGDELTAWDVDMGTLWTDWRLFHAPIEDEV